MSKMLLDALPDNDGIDQVQSGVLSPDWCWDNIHSFLKRCVTFSGSSDISARVPK